MTRRKMADEPERVEQTLPLHLKYRPASFKDVLGQDACIKSLKAAMSAAAKPHTFAFTGPPGTGKTTLARLVAVACDVGADSITEIDAASNSGIDAMREVTSALRYQGFGASPNKMIIIDEAHGLSKQAFDSLLKTLEEPPPHVYFALCTTMPSKLPAAIVTRCQTYALQPVRQKLLEDLLFHVCDEEGYRTPDDVVLAAVEGAGGSPRQALVNLAKVHDISEIEEALALLQVSAADKEIIDVAKQLVARSLTWKTLRATLKAIPSPDAESIRIVLSCYIAGCVMNARDDRDIAELCAIAYKFSKPFNPTDKLMPLFIAFDELIGN